jgi:hypothetical protein
VAPAIVKIADKRAALADCAVNAVLHVGCARQTEFGPTTRHSSGMSFSSSRNKREFTIGDFTPARMLARIGP